MGSIPTGGNCKLSSILNFYFGSSIGRAAVLHTVGCGFKSYPEQRQVAERLIAMVLKTVVRSTVGSNPTLSISGSLMVKHSAHDRWIVGSSPTRKTIFLFLL